MIRYSVRKMLCTFAVLALTVCSVLASPQDQYLQIYLLIQEAEKLESAGQLASARDRYQTCKQRLEELQKEFSEWEPVIVRYRINFCREKIEKLSLAKDENSAETPTPVVPIAQDSSPAPTEAFTSPVTPTVSMDTTDINVLKNRIQTLEGELSSTRTKLKNALAEASQLRSRQQVLEKQVEVLKQSGASDARVEQLLQENSELRQRLTQAQSQITGKTAAGVNVDALKEQLRKAEDQLALATQQNYALQQANDEYKRQLQILKNQVGASDQLYGNVDELRNENKILKDIINRQLKEQARREASKRLALEELDNMKVESTALRTQIEILGSPLIRLTEEEKQLLRAPSPSVVMVDTTGNISTTIEQSTDDYSTKPRVPPDFREIAEEAVNLFSSRQFEEAAAKYQMILNSHPDSLYALSNLGVVRFQQQNYSEAEKVLRRAIALSPQDAFSHSILGIVLYQQGKYDEAVQILTRAVALNPNDPKTRNYLGISASQKGWQEAAEQECRKAIELDANYGDAHFNLAVIYATQRPPAKELARRHYNKALELGVPRDEQLEKLLNS